MTVVFTVSKVICSPCYILHINPQLFPSKPLMGGQSLTYIYNNGLILEVLLLQGSNQLKNKL